ncbi:hypothetical protein [Methanosarcina barkeri]|nr:hypothetical protein [Methanosarcina barkeri]
MDRGGVLTIEDDVKIGPKVNLITSNHPLNPSHRRAIMSTPIWVKRNVLIGAAATVFTRCNYRRKLCLGSCSCRYA